GSTLLFGEVGRGLVSPVLQGQGHRNGNAVSPPPVGPPPPPLPALHVPHRDCCCNAPPELRNRDISRPPPRSGRGRLVAPAGMRHALACLAGPAGSGGSGDRGAPGQTSGASASSDD